MLKKKLAKNLRAMGILTILKSILQKENNVISESFGELENFGVLKKDDELKEDDEIIFNFKIKLTKNDILWLQNLPERKIDNILKDAKKLLDKYCSLWDKKWWKIFQKKKGGSNG